MAARQSLEGDERDHYLMELMNPSMISLTDYAEGRPCTWSVPEVIACDVSSRLRRLCSERGRSFTVDELLQESQSAFTERLIMCEANFADILASFTMWLYSGIARTRDNYQHDLWYFGQRIGSPRFQNDVMRELCRRHSNQAEDDDPENCLDVCDVERIWNLTYPATADMEELGGAGTEERLEGQKMMLYALDYLVFLGVTHPLVKQVYLAGGLLTWELAKRVQDAPRPFPGRPCHPPWHPDNIETYLVKEDLVPSNCSKDGSEMMT